MVGIARHGGGVDGHMVPDPAGLPVAPGWRGAVVTLLLWLLGVGFYAFAAVT
jgi:hypothetical protein